MVEWAEVVDVWGRSLGADVSEHPAHTLPAELQAELGIGEVETFRPTKTP